MPCESCGKKEAKFHVRYEVDLCEECKKELTAEDVKDAYLKLLKNNKVLKAALRARDAQIDKLKQDLAAWRGEIGNKVKIRKKGG